MIVLDTKPCTVCGAITDFKLLFDKSIDRGDDGDVELHRCGFCKTVFLGKYNESFDDEMYDYYQKYQGKKKEEVYDPLTEKSFMQVLRLLASYGGGKSILDVGCGKGDFVDAALRAGYDVEGIDLSQHAVDIAQGFGLPVHKLDFFQKKYKVRPWIL